MLEATLELEGTWEEIRAHETELAGRRIWLRVLPSPVSTSPAEAEQGVFTATQLMAMPYGERARYLEGRAARAEQVYRDHPELLDFEAFGEDDLFDETSTR